jgi:hypothetical protein
MRIHGSVVPGRVPFDSTVVGGEGYPGTEMMSVGRRVVLPGSEAAVVQPFVHPPPPGSRLLFYIGEDVHSSRLIKSLVANGGRCRQL